MDGFGFEINSDKEWHRIPRKVTGGDVMVGVRQDEVQVPNVQGEGARMTPPLEAEREHEVGKGQSKSDTGTVLDRPRVRECAAHNSTARASVEGMS